MSRSRRKTKIFPSTCAASEKKDKQLHNRAMRRHVKVQVHKEDFDKPFPVDNEISNVWCWDKDGKGYWGDAPDEFMRK